MPPLSFRRRIQTALGSLLIIGLLTAPLLMYWWIGTLIAGLLQVSAAALLYRWIVHYVDEQHADFLKVFQDLRRNLPSGQRGLMLKSLRAQDSFGKIADETNLIIEEISSQISQQIATNRDLEQNKTLFQSILTTMVEGVLVLDSKRQVLFFNNAARRMLDCTSRHLVGRPLWEVVRAPDLVQVIEDVFEARSEFRKELELQRSRSVIEISAARLPLQSETGIVLVLHDVTDVRRLERMRREFVSNVSHELKTPLTSIQVYADTLLDGGGLEDTENSRLFVTRIMEQSSRLQQLIQDLLRLARIESHSEAFDLKPVVLKTMLESCVDDRRAVAAAKEIQLTLTNDIPDVKVLVDASGLQTIIDNLVSNAIDYTPSGGHVQVRSRLEADEVVVEVEDDGIGIALEHQPRIFERFYRADKARSPGQGGTGLGLAIVKHLVGVFDGEISLQSELGHGSCFAFRLPVIADPA